MVNPPLQRHPALQPFSRDHYVGLVVAEHLRRSATSTVAERLSAMREFMAAWDKEISDHFAEEERLLRPLLTTENDWTRLLSEHDTLRDLQRQAATEPERAADAEWMLRLGSVLHDHIRWEERELFPRIEKTVSASGLQHLSLETRELEARRNRNPRQDT